MKYSFPAIFKEDEEDKSLINVTFVDIFGAYTFGEGEEEAMEMAKDLLKLLLEEERYQNTKPTPIENIKAENAKVLMVEVEV